MNISFRDSLPRTSTGIDSFLIDKGFECAETDIYGSAPTCDSVRWRRYFKEFKKCDSNVFVRVVIGFELCIRDDPFATFEQNHDLSFNDVQLEIWARRIDEDEFRRWDYHQEVLLDEETETPRKVGTYTLSPESFSDLERVMLMLA